MATSRGHFWSRGPGSEHVVNIAKNNDNSERLCLSLGGALAAGPLLSGQMDARPGAKWAGELGGPVGRRRAHPGRPPEARMGPANLRQAIELLIIN